MCDFLYEELEYRVPWYDQLSFPYVACVVHGSVPWRPTELSRMIALYLHKLWGASMCSLSFTKSFVRAGTDQRLRYNTE